ncbi:hypothetical protein AB5I41_10660 [Sphingomonas sp. MMS24-JH45]
MLVIGGDERFEAWLHTDPQVRKAQQAIATGQRIEIISARGLE